MKRVPRLLQQLHNCRDGFTTTASTCLFESCIFAVCFVQFHSPLIFPWALILYSVHERKPLNAYKTQFLSSLPPSSSYFALTPSSKYPKEKTNQHYLCSINIRVLKAHANIHMNIPMGNSRAPSHPPLHIPPINFTCRNHCSRHPDIFWLGLELLKEMNVELGRNIKGK